LKFLVFTKSPAEDNSPNERQEAEKRNGKFLHGNETLINPTLTTAMPPTSISLGFNTTHYGIDINVPVLPSNIFSQLWIIPPIIKTVFHGELEYLNF